MSLTSPAARRDQSFHLHPATNLRTLQKEGPLVITRGEGVYVYDDEGRRYLEGMSGLWCASLGFSERRLAEAAYRQMCELDVTYVRSWSLWLDIRILLRTIPVVLFNSGRAA